MYLHVRLALSKTTILYSAWRRGSAVCDEKKYYFGIIPNEVNSSDTEKLITYLKTIYFFTYYLSVSFLNDHSETERQNILLFSTDSQGNACRRVW